jgi:aminoglycoside N3'-acetyltransferase
MLGMTYASSTSHHFAEFVCEVPYRHTIDMKVKVRREDGTIYEQAMTDYQPKPSGGSYYGSRTPDFNCLGRMLEERGRVGFAAIGNSAVRRFAMRDLVDLAQEEAARDFNIFRAPEGETDYATPLDFGTVVTSPEMLDGAGRPGRNKWCVIDPDKLEMPS